MPVPTLFYLVEHGPPQWLRDRAILITVALVLVSLVILVKRQTAGQTYRSTAVMHGKVVMMTGATSGIGAEVAFDLARRGAQLVLLTHAPTTDPFLADFVQDLRDRTGNQLIHAEHVDLVSLHSVRKFATAWIDSAPPRRLDTVILCGALAAPPGSRRRVVEGTDVEEMWMVNFVANFHLLALLSPAVRAQPPDRQVRIVLPVCSAAYIGSMSLREEMTAARWTASRAYRRSKLALCVFGGAYQKHLDAYKRPDGMPMTARVVMADPGLCRTPGMLRWLTRGSLMGLAVYLLGYMVPWLLLKSARGGAQSILYAAMEPRLGGGGGGGRNRLVKECSEVEFARAEVHDEEVARRLWEESDKLIEETEKRQAKMRAWLKGREAEREAKRREEEQVRELESLVTAVKKGKERERRREGGDEKDGRVKEKGGKTKRGK